MTTKPTLRELHQSKQPIVTGWVGMPGPFGAELAARAGFDCLVFDMQHGMIGFADVLHMLMAAQMVGTPCLVRVPSAFDHVKTDVIMQVLDAGAWGVIVPQMDSPAIAKQIVSACRYPPVGQRSHGPTRAMHAHGPNYPQRANAEVLVFGMIESAPALAQLDEILDTPGLDGIYIGPNDFSLALGAKPASEPTDEHVVQAIDKVRLAAQKRGLITGIFCSNGEACAMRLAQGFDMVNPSHDVATLAAAHSQRVAAARSHHPLALQKAH